MEISEKLCKELRDPRVRDPLSRKDAIYGDGTRGNFAGLGVCDWHWWIGLIYQLNLT